MELTYTDSLCEAENRDGRMLGTQGVCDMVNTFSSLPPESLIPRLLLAIRESNPGNLMSDDTTLMLLRSSGSEVCFIANLRIPLRILKVPWQARFPTTSAAAIIEVKGAPLQR